MPVQIAGEARRVAVLGIAPESRADRPAHYVAQSLQDDGVKIVPVPVYYFDVQVVIGDQMMHMSQHVALPAG